MFTFTYNRKQIDQFPIVDVLNGAKSTTKKPAVIVGV